MLCATPLVLAALNGPGPVFHPGVVAPVRPRTAPAPPAAGKTIWGNPLPNHLSSDNIAVGWEGSTDYTRPAERVLEAVETAWSNLVVDQGWPGPRSSEDHLLWFILDPSLGHTGYTTLAFDDDHPDGVPVVYLNPDYAAYGAFWEHLAVHEFNHMLQYRLRDWESASEEAWYWEASAEWGAELGVPEVDFYGVQAGYYAATPELRYDTIDGRHEYGMLLLNAWLEEHVLGTGGLLAVWTAGSEQSHDDWLTVLEDSTGLDHEDLWAGFTAAYANQDLRESPLYEAPVLQGELSDGASGQLALLGTDYWTCAEDTRVTVEGDAILGGAGGTGSAVTALAGEVLTVTAVKQNADYTLALAEPTDPIDTGDSAGPSDPGEPGETGLPDEDAVACGCRTGPRSGSAWVWLAALGGLILSRRSVATPAHRRV